MRVLVLAALLPTLAAAQIDVTPGPDAPPGSIHLLIQAAGPWSEAPPALAWCVADAYFDIARRTENARIAAASARAGRQWERVAAARLAQIPSGVLQPVGAEVVVPVRPGVVCRTRARAPYPMKG